MTGKRIWLIVLLFAPLLAISQDKLVLRNGDILHGKVWDLNQTSLVFEDKEGNFFNYEQEDLEKVFLDEYTNAEIIEMIRRGSISPKQQGEEKTRGRIGMALLNFGAGFCSAKTGVIPANGLQSDAMIRNEIRDNNSKEESHYLGYVSKAKKQNRRNFSLGFVGGMISNLLTHPGRTVRIF